MAETPEPRTANLARQATWTLRSYDPKTAWGWIVWAETRPSEEIQRRLKRALPLGLLIVAIPSLLFGLGGFVTSVALLWFAVALYARPGAREHGQLLSLGEDEAFPMNVEIRQGLRLLGRENGWLAFADGWLIFEGLRTEFSLHTNDALCVSVRGQDFVVEVYGGLELRFRLLTSFRETSHPAGRLAPKRSEEAFLRWRRDPAPEGQSVYPPVTVSPGTLANTARNSAYVATIGLLLLTAFANLALGQPALITLAVTLFFATRATLAWRALKDTLTTSRSTPAKEKTQGATGKGDESCSRHQ